MAQYESLKDYLSLNRKDDILHKANEYLQVKKSNHILKDIEILTVRCTEDLPPTAMILIEVKAEEYDVVSKMVSNKLYSMAFLGTVMDGFSDMTISIVEEISEADLQSDDVRSLFGLPEISKADLEEKANWLYSALYKRITHDPDHKYRFDPVKVKEKFKASDNMHMWPAELEKGILGQIRFTPSRADIYNIEDMSKCYYNELIPENSILLNSGYYKGQSQHYDDILVATHELVHWSIHQLYFYIRRLLEGNFDIMNCSSEPIVLDDSMSPKEKAYWYAEWQANELSFRVAMPKHLVAEAISEYEKCFGSCPHDGNYYQNMINKLAWDFNVPAEIMKKRFRQLGYDYADGTFVTIDDRTYHPFTFAKGTLKENETFVIDRRNYERLLREEKGIAELIENRYCLYTGYVICINDVKYIRPVSADNGLSFELSDHALEHADECCLKLTLHEKQCASIYTALDFLCKLDEGEYSKDYRLTQEANNDWESYKRMKEDEKEAKRILADMDKANVVSFKEALRFYIKLKGLHPEDICDEVYLKESTFMSYYKGNRNPSLENVLIICNKLSLSYDLSIDLLKRTRITLNTEDNKDMLYDYLLTITNATLYDWDLFLKENGSPTLVDHSKKVKIK